MPRNYTRAQQRKYREEHRAQAARVADRLLGKKKVDPDAESFFGGSQVILPVHYNANIVVNHPRLSSIITGIEGI